MSYGTLLQDRRWKDLRAQIIQQREGICCYCGEKPEHPQVHHGYYAKDKKPWEYEDWSLHLVCPGCHSVWQTEANHLKRLIGGLTPRGIVKLSGLARLVERDEIEEAERVAKFNDYAECP